MTLDDEIQRALFEIAARKKNGTFEYAEGEQIMVYRCGYCGGLHRALVQFAVTVLDVVPEQKVQTPDLVPNEQAETHTTPLPDYVRKAFEEA